MEPFNATADVRPGACEVWAPTQVPNRAFDDAVRITGLPPERVKVHVTFMGGGFGRRLHASDTIEAVRVSMAVGAPVKVIHTREDDMRRDFYRPGSRHVMKAGLDGSGRLMAWTHRVITPSIGAQLGGVPEGTLDEDAVSGAANLPYAIPNIWVDFVMASTPVPIGWWRSVLDEVAAAAGADPFDLRRRLLRGSPRHLGVLEAAAERAGWGTPPPPGRHRGIAVHFCFGSWAADVAEVSVTRAGQVRVHRIVCAIDCGSVVNPLGVEAQVHGATVFGLTAALKSAITVKDGRIEQGNFDDYPVLRMNEMPLIESVIVPSDAPPSGAGEPPLPPVAPAVANAVFAATGRRVRRLPLTPEALRRA
jgi:isoquinoline 1-oxidoreductase beta subunit